jgi:hypothetical protein
MMIHLFVQAGCTSCNNVLPIVPILVGKGHVVRVWYIHELNGMTEAAYHSIRQTPAVVVEDDEGDVKLKIQNFKADELMNDPLISPELATDILQHL